MNKIITTILIFFFSIYLNAQTIQGYSFANYKCEISKATKRVMPNSKEMEGIFMRGDDVENKKNMLKYFKTTKINFGGFYISYMDGCGSSCVYGMMLDIRSGKIYGLPLGGVGESQGVNSCSEGFEDEEEIFNFKPNSKLFIALGCGMDYLENNKYVAKKTYYITIWNEQKKKFEKLKTVNKNVKGTSKN